MTTPSPAVRLAHLSDIHIYEMRGARPWHFLGKRVTGGLNLLLGRSRVHQNQVVVQALEQIRGQAVDHIVITGDLSNLALRGEFQAARDLLDTYAGGPERLSVIPGNHDYYTRGAVRRRDFESFFKPWMQCQVGLQHDGVYPYVKHCGPQGGVALVGINSCIPSPPTLAIGRVGQAQRAALEEVLAHPEVAARFRLAALHHHLEPPHHTNTRKEMFRQLRDRKEVMRTLRQGHVHLVIHGHNHQHSTRQYTWSGGQGQMTICEAGSSSVGSFHEELRGGKYNLYDLEPDEQGQLYLSRVHTWLYRPEQATFVHWRTWENPHVQG